MQKKVVEGEGKAGGWGKWWGKESSPFDGSIYCRVAAVSESLGALRPEFLRSAAPRHSVEGYIRRRGGEVTGAEFCCRDPSAGLSRFRSLRCARFRHCGSPGPWSLRPRLELFRLPASFLRPRRLSCWAQPPPSPFSSSPWRARAATAPQPQWQEETIPPDSAMAQILPIRFQEHLQVRWAGAREGCGDGGGRKEEAGVWVQAKE